MMEPNPAKLAILIDAENVLPSHAELIFSTAEAMGDVVAKEIFGVAAALTTWVEPVLRYAIHPNLTIKASKGKNTSDIALVIGAMDLLLKGEVNTVVIASSDSDFSTLSVRLRTAGIRVVGMGTEKSNALWRTACSSFIVLEHPAQQPKQQAQKQAQQAAKQPPKQQAQKQPPQQPQPQPAEAPAPQAQPPKATASATHEERAAAIQQVILKRLASNGGRVQVGTLFTALNRMPEYRADRQGSG
ncbi:MAG: NYN domain-containing protein, partial [Clostridia bacterium]|nr:NYN domain-containing protein [Clostridia bacterium]